MNLQPILGPSGGAYSQADLRELDAYAQTWALNWCLRDLALNQFFQWEHINSQYADLVTSSTKGRDLYLNRPNVGLSLLVLQPSAFT